MSSYKPIAYPPPPPPPPPGSPAPCLPPGPPPPLPKALRVGAAITPVFDEQKAIDRALSDDDDMLTRIRYPAEKQAFWSFLSTKTAEIEAIVSHHMRLKTCRVGTINTWISGSFNVCIPVYISPTSDACVLFRIPLPYKVGEAEHPGNVDEKLRCEAAAYMWIQEESPTTPIPKLYGCGFPDGQTFTCPENVPLITRLVWRIKRTLCSWLQVAVPCHYVGRRYPDTLKTGYLILSYVTNGVMLSRSWETCRHDLSRRSNLFHGLARIILSLNKSRLPRIGSLTLNNQGVISLTNRPLTLRLQALENEGIPTNISRNETYSAADPYLLDLLGCQDNRIYHQPNSMHSEADGRQQLAALTMMRAILHQYVNRDYRHGPFVFTLTDLHQSNIFVDDEWNITSLIDLEWACSLPIQLQCPPYWLSGRAVDEMPHGEHLETFRQVISEFFKAFEEEESRMLGQQQPLYQAPLMRRFWEGGGFWYFHAVNSPKGMYTIFNQHVQRQFCEQHCRTRIFDEVVAPYWCRDAAGVIERKLKDEECYKDRLREALAEDASLIDPARW